MACKILCLINSYQISEILDQYILVKGYPKSTLEYGSVNYRILTDHSLEAAAIVSIVSPCIGECEIGREKLKSMKFIYL